ncbi:MAG: ABC transporter permease subunit [Proteobacteria bacterium]|nr:ABC transporter permease subunit [Pseudomonadota bacterium]
MQTKKSTLSIFILFLGYAFLYLPIAYLLFFSFNNSPIPGKWTGFTLKWYYDLFHNEALFKSFLTSLQIATISATCAVILGTIAAVAMTRFRKFKGKTFLSSLLPLPLIMPDVITGVALLLMFVTFERMIGIPSERGILTVSIAHITIGIAYVYMIVQSRLQYFDQSIEEAALDLGAKPHVVFFKITLPIIRISLLSGWLLAFALSLDDVVIASFLSGPGATTLPMVLFSSLRLGVSPEINALAGVVILIVFLSVLLAGFFYYKAEENGKKEIL